MRSQFGWMDHDESQRRRVLAAIELFKDDGTVDELGVGAVRDTIAGALFPGVSVLHTRARYLLFVPWCVQRAADANLPASDAMRELRRQELLVLDALLRGGDEDGLIGRVARHKVKRLPSAAYWSVLRRWGIRRTGTSLAGYFRDAKAARALDTRAARSDDVETGLDPSFVGLDPSLPKPPGDFTTSTTFALGGDEATYLADRWQMTAGDSLLPWVLHHGADDSIDNVWSHPDIGSAPAAMRELVDLGWQFSELTHGAALLYNIMLAERRDGEEDQQIALRHRQALTDWRERIAAGSLVALWDPDTFWRTVRQRNNGLKRGTENFVNRWIELLSKADGSLADNADAQRLVADRERSIKGGRARLFNQSALNHWTGASGLVRLDYNWRVTRRLTQDVLAGMSSAEGAVA